MKYRRHKDGMVVTIMAPPRNPPPGKDNARFARTLERWMYLKPRSRRAAIKRMKALPQSHWAKREGWPWALANEKVPTLPCETITLLPHSREEEDALTAYWDGYLDACDRLAGLERNWAHLTRAERDAAIDLAELMAAEFMGYRHQMKWMIDHLEDPVVRRSE